MSENKLKGIDAAIFDIGDTLLKFPLSIEEYHFKFLKQILGADFEVTSEQLSSAIDIAEHMVGMHHFDSRVGYDHLITSDEWHLVDKTLLKQLGVTENLDDLAAQYQSLWIDLLESTGHAPLPGAKEVLSYLKEKGYLLGVASNWDKPPHKQLEEHDLLKFFDDIQWTLVRGYAKPSPYMLIMASHNLGVNPRRCVFIGNSIAKDVEAAKRAGMKSILLSPYESEVEDVIVIQELIKIKKLL
ncbi:MAG: HAD-IA family hydrolase [Candidatus Lokiarchaeota archaeon]|nr:HAD-IA family hydrolase [Candidatus Lokiarchaeota archaeon]